MDAAGLIEADHPGRHARQHGLGKPAPFVKLTVGLDQLPLLRLDLIGHPVEGAAQRSEFVILLSFGDAGRKIAGPHPLGGANESADRIGELGGEVDPYGYRGDEKQHCHEYEDHGEGDLEAGALQLQALVLRRREMRLVAVRQYPRLDEADEIKIEVAELAEPDQGAYPLFLVLGDDDD